MSIVLAQRIDYESDYQDVPFHLYHFPRRPYEKLIHSGDQFVYYQGDRHNSQHRYYFGTGIIGALVHAPDHVHSYAHILTGVQFTKKVPI